MVRRTKAWAAAFAVSALASSAAMAQDNGLYTEQQAQRGETAYQSNCSQCHGRELEGIEAPALTGQDFLGNWGTAAGVHGYFSVAMPPQAPGQLGEDVYLDILAYILEFNGVPPGTDGLTNDSAALEAIDLVALGSPSEPAETPATPAATPATPVVAATVDAATTVPQAFTWGKQLPAVEGAQPAANAAAAAPAQTGVPQAFTWGKQLPAVEAAAGAAPRP